MTFLDPTTIAMLESFSVKAQVIVEGALTGLHRATMRGFSIEFSEHKKYTQGDDIRHLDWKVLGKADRYYIKQFEQESELTCYLAVDASGSMHYSGKGVSKRTYACTLAAALAYLLIRQGECVGLTVFGTGHRDHEIPPRRSSAQLRAILGTLAEVNESTASDDEPPTAALERMVTRAGKRRGLIVVISDLFDSTGSPLSVMRHLRARGHDPVVFQTMDRDELEFPFEGLSAFESLETDERILVDPAAIRRLYRKRIKEFVDASKSECLRGQIEHHLAVTDQPFEFTLMSFLEGRLRSRSSAAKVINR